LTGSDRRKLERHLIGCTDCRDRLASLCASLGALQALGAGDLPSADSPSLWPALARQIREERRPAPESFWARPVSWLGVAAAPRGLVTFGVAGTLSVRHYQRGAHLRTASVASPRTAAPAAPSSAAVSEVNSSPVVADNGSSHRPEGDNAGHPSTASTSSRGNGPGSPAAGIRTPEPTH